MLFRSRARAKGVRFTSLLNLWFADAPRCRTICVTGTKGKSTTTALIAHILRGVGWRAAAAGNIGVPVMDLPREDETKDPTLADFEGAFSARSHVGVTLSDATSADTLLSPSARAAISWRRVGQAMAWKMLSLFGFRAIRNYNISKR